MGSERPSSDASPGICWMARVSDVVPAATGVGASALDIGHSFRVSAVNLRLESSGRGSPVLLLHAGMADGRMWDAQVPILAASHQVLRCDLRGFGRTPLVGGEFSYAADVLGALDQSGVDHTFIVGASVGGRVALEIAVLAPSRVDGLMLVGSGLPGFVWSAQTREYWSREQALLDREDLDGAVAGSLDYWLGGDEGSIRLGDFRGLVAEMQRTAFSHRVGCVDSSSERPLVPNLLDRLSEIAVPTLVSVGERDVDDIRRIAEVLATRIPGALYRTIRGAAHLPALETPTVLNVMLGEFLALHLLAP